MPNINSRDDKVQLVADVVFLTNKTTLAEHYRLIGKVLNEIRKNDETKWIWNKVRIELDDLAEKVERDLGKYNAMGVGFGEFVDFSEVCWNCISSCTIGCTVEQLIPQLPGIGTLCYYLVEGCILFPSVDNPACVGAALCVGGVGVGCFLLVLLPL